MTDKATRCKPLAKKDEDIRVIFSSRDQFKEFLSFEKECAKEFRRFFSRKERIIYYCGRVLGWGRDKIRQKAGISTRQVRRFFVKIREFD